MERKKHPSAKEKEKVRGGCAIKPPPKMKKKHELFMLLVTDTQCKVDKIKKIKSLKT